MVQNNTNLEPVDFNPSEYEYTFTLKLKDIIKLMRLALYCRIVFKNDVFRYYAGGAVKVCEQMFRQIDLTILANMIKEEFKQTE